MEKLKKFTPTTVSISGKQIVVSEPAFNKIIEYINVQTETINILMDYILANKNSLQKTNDYVSKLQNSTETLAKALQTITEEE